MAYARPPISHRHPDFFRDHQRGLDLCRQDYVHCRSTQAKILISEPAPPIREKLIDPANINGRVFSKRDLMQVRMGSRDPISLMFQTAYLTIGSYDEELESYTLRFPNKEVDIAFSEDLLPFYFEDSTNPQQPFSVVSFRRDLKEGNPE